MNAINLGILGWTDRGVAMELIQVLGVFLASALGAGTILRFSAEKMIEASVEKVLHQKTLLTEADLAYRQRQLEEFYGPIYASLKLSSQIHPLWMEGHLEAVNPDVIDLFHQQNTDIITILKTKAHLIDGRDFPPEFVHFMTSATVWGMFCARPEHPYMPDAVASLEAVKWPQAFEDHIYGKTEELKRTLDDLLIRYRIK
ncbi:MAG: hypothetical protein AAFU71_17795 [Cyanobacteria bacterium J06632_22]